MSCDLRHPEDCTCDAGSFVDDPVGHLVIVTWDDTTNMAAWLDDAELADFARNGAWRAENVGWVTWSDDDCIVLSARRTIAGDKHLGLSERIPRRAIINIVRVVAVPTDHEDQP